MIPDKIPDLRLRVRIHRDRGPAGLHSVLRDQLCHAVLFDQRQLSRHSSLPGAVFRHCCFPGILRGRIVLSARCRLLPVRIDVCLRFVLRSFLSGSGNAIIGNFIPGNPIPGVSVIGNPVPEGIVPGSLFRVPGNYFCIFGSLFSISGSLLHILRGLSVSENFLLSGSILCFLRNLLRIHGILLLVPGNIFLGSGPLFLRIFLRLLLHTSSLVLIPGRLPCSGRFLPALRSLFFGRKRILLRRKPVFFQSLRSISRSFRYRFRHLPRHPCLSRKNRDLQRARDQ